MIAFLFKPSVVTSHKKDDLFLHFFLLFCFCHQLCGLGNKFFLLITFVLVGCDSLWISVFCNQKKSVLLLELWFCLLSGMLQIHVNVELLEYFCH